MIDVRIEDLFGLVVSNRSEAPTALYLIKNNEVVEKTRYITFNRHVFGLRSAGHYSVRWFVRSEDGEILRGQSKPIRFKGFSGLREDGSDKEKPVALLGINPFTLYAAKLLDHKFEVRGIIDPSGSHVGSRVMGFDVLREADVQDCM